jgi:hypothetical protein
MLYGREIFLTDSVNVVLSPCYVYTCISFSMSCSLDILKYLVTYYNLQKNTLKD